MIKRVLSLIGIGTLALLVATPANAKVIDKNKAFSVCKSNVKGQYEATRYRLDKIRDSRGEYRIQFVVSSKEGRQKVICTLDKYSGSMKLTAL